MPRGRRRGRQEKIRKARRIWCGWTTWWPAISAGSVFELTGQSPLINDNLGDPNAIRKTWQPLILLSNLRIHLKKSFDGLVKGRFDFFLCAFQSGASLRAPAAVFRTTAFLTSPRSPGATTHLRKQKQLGHEISSPFPSVAFELHWSNRRERATSSNVIIYRRGLLYRQSFGREKAIGVFL